MIPLLYLKLLYILDTGNVKLEIRQIRGNLEHITILYETYPGPYFPQPIEIRTVESEEANETICDEILSLTKMNWKNTQFDGKYSVTLECDRRVGQIMKYVGPDGKPQIRYAFYI